MNQTVATQLPLAPVLGEGPKTTSPVGHAQLSNMGLALRTLTDCVEAGEHSPRMGLFYGFSGYGKSVGAAFATARTGAAYIEARSIWTQRSLLEAIAEELGLTRPERTAPRLLRQIIEELNRAPRPLIIDEMDHLVKRHMVEIIRDIHDATPVAIMMIGEEALPAKLKEWERFDNRILICTPAQPASADDALKLRNHYCRAVTVADDLALYFHERCKGVTRRVVVNLQAAEREAAVADVAAIDRAWWGARPVRTGDIPTRRSMGGF
ncbi:MAG: ATP-binding protein [Sphingopyxis sp.]